MTTLQNQPDVSFVIAAYNAEETIARAIESALAQVGVTLEVVVVDDCSTDHTVEIVRQIADPRVTVICQPSNGGPARARNRGIEAASGAWVAVLDADDEISAHRSARMIARADALTTPLVVDNLDVVAMDGGRSWRMFTEDELRARARLTLADYIGSNVLFRSTFNFGYMKPMFARDFLQRHDLAFDERLRIGEDYLLVASALASGATCAVEPSAGYIYHLRQGSISRVLDLHHVDSMLAADRVFLNRFHLSDEALVAQRRRTRSLLEARAFLTLVSHIKNRSAAGALKTAIETPRALWHLRMPIVKRLRRLMPTSTPVS
ncbi:glycosyltransferase family 2 protein [Pseudorhizobium marinum]|uniref:glycosyltransferase family 2 protein n=1 Tax=Pseudorhizobium marinum TaxID=1496690 RepID=UPI0004959F75|nr:glycosyltransferase family 2 protein [Pseudorhizobium marinum]